MHKELKAQQGLREVSKELQVLWEQQVLKVQQVLKEESKEQQGQRVQ